MANRRNVCELSVAMSVLDLDPCLNGNVNSAASLICSLYPWKFFVVLALSFREE